MSRSLSLAIPLEPAPGQVPTFAYLEDSLERPHGAFLEPLLSWGGASTLLEKAPRKKSLEGARKAPPLFQEALPPAPSGGHPQPQGPAQPRSNVVALPAHYHGRLYNAWKRVQDLGKVPQAHALLLAVLQEVPPTVSPRLYALRCEEAAFNALQGLLSREKNS